MRLEELMNQHYQALNDNDKQICRFILDHKKECYLLSIQEFARACHVSKTTLFRFAKKISLPGFAELKARLRLEVKEAEEVKKDLLITVTDSYHKMIDQIGELDCTSLFHKMAEAERILIYGSGYAQARVASEFKRIFLPVRRKIFTMHGSDMAESLNQLARADDFVILISLSGESEGVIRIGESLRLRQIPCLSITRLKRNSLSAICGENLYIHSIPLPVHYGIDYEISTPYFILIELLFLKYQRYLEE